MEITINIDTRKKAGAELLNFLKSLSFVKVKEEKKPSKLLLNSVKEAKNKKNLTEMNGKDKLSKFLINEL